MKIHIAGIYHPDPLCRCYLKQWLKQLSTNYAVDPAFIATEWDENIFTEVKKQRNKFRELAQTKWPGATSDLLDELALSLGYEADTHIEIYPNVDILWLDQGRKEESDEVREYARDRLAMYISYLGGEPLPNDNTSALTKLSLEARARTQSDRQGDERDKKFCRLILERIENGGGDWAIVIVGAVHAEQVDGSMCRLLEEARQLCEVTIL